jgi:protein pelota
VFRVKIQQVDLLKKFIRVLPENTLDLLNIFRLVSIGDIIYSETSREVKKERADGRYDSERVLVTLGIDVEKKSIDSLLKRISFTGRIVYESRELGLTGKYHTIHVHPGLELKIESKERFDRLYSFSLSYPKKKSKKILCITIDDEGIAVSKFSNLGLKTLYSKNIPSRIKMYEEPVEDLIYDRFSEVVKLVLDILKEDEDVEVAILGSGIIVEEFINYLKKRNIKNILNKIKKRGYTSTGREEGLREALRSGELKEYAEEIKPVEDSLEVEDFIQKMSKNPEKVALGLREVLEAMKMKTVEKILVSESFLWENIVDERLSSLLDEAEHGRIKLRVILDGLEASEKIRGLGGIVATLYYPARLTNTQNKETI